MSDLTSWLALNAVPGVGAYRFQMLLRRFGTPEAALRASLSELLKVPGLGPQTAAAIQSCPAYDFAERQIRLAERHGVRLVTIHDEAYPVRLRQIFDPPPLLYMRGSLETRDEQAIAVVGTRRATPYGRRITERFCEALVEAGFTIISGLARGIDTVAHRCALHRAGRTVAVLGSGHDRPYPPENRTVIEQATRAGAVITEFPFGTGPDAMNFPQRNRIISGMSLGVIVVEAGRASGAMITAQYALDQDREVFAVPGLLTSPASEGTNYLIKSGAAKLVQDVVDIIEEVGAGIGLAVAPKEAESKTAQLPLLPEEDRVYNTLSDTPLHIDRIATTANLSTSETLAVLLGLELKGVIRQLPGKRFVQHYSG